eukprot:Opistho-2@68048
MLTDGVSAALRLTPRKCTPCDLRALQVAVCNLASIALPKFVRENGEFDHQKLFDVTRVVTRNLNRIIDINHYPVPQARKSNFRWAGHVNLRWCVRATYT